MEDEVVGQKEERGDQRDGEEGEEVNGEVESIRETHMEVTRTVDIQQRRKHR